MVKLMRILSRHKLVLAILLAELVMPCAAAMAAGDVDIALHKALYDLKMVSAEPNAGINDVTGKIYFEQDATCDAWTTEQRLTTEYQYADTAPVTDTGRYAAFESKDGQQFSFNADRLEDGEATEQLRGTVEKDANGAAKAIYSRPDDIKYDLPQGYLLPTAHTMEIIRHARAGDHFFNAVMFDGTDADGPVEVGTFIGKKVMPEELKKISGDNKKIDLSLLIPEAWHVRMAIFPIKDKDESVPAYEMEIVLHANGVISHALVDYKTFAVEQDLTALEKLPARKCD